MSQYTSGQHGDVVVITGASSGIGRATARAFAERGARLVLASRSRPSLEEVATECRGQGAQEVLVMPTDVSDEDQVRALVQAAVETFGRIDVWVGAASVYSYGTVEQTPSDVFRQVLETNLLGQVYTARTLLPRFRIQGSGTLIVIGSVYSKITSPYVSPYITSKFGLLGFTEALRQELREVEGVNVCAVLPATIDTPIYQHAANYTGQQVHPLPPVVSPHRVARAIVGLADRPRPTVVVGQIQRSFIPVHALLPRLYDRCIGPVMNTLALRKGPVAPTPGTVFEPDPAANQITGGWRSRPWRMAAVAAMTAAAGAVVTRARATAAGMPGKPRPQQRPRFSRRAR
ncbi:SDR family NAD(P)-dependent oxidoreductase [Arthrobacter sp. CG_A4]|uniref:SDR family NAD(P)-dependent oxidoreductase n=1 Tax=Arthrobacter sp. CG_A4 TaxID=3071706 RepID=UPI002E0241FD|nr:short-subunit dehydrogenase [Arthrobacter sp. CG_A4]